MSFPTCIECRFRNGRYCQVFQKELKDDVAMLCEHHEREGDEDENRMFFRRVLGKNNIRRA